jgi:hypothetical protein
MRLTSRPSDAPPEGGADVGRRIGGAEMHPRAPRREPEGDGRGERGLADAPFAHHQDQPLLRPRQLIHQRGQRGQLHGRPRGRARRGGRCVGEQRAQRRQTHHVEAREGHLEAWQFAEPRGQLGQGDGPPTLERGGHRVVCQRGPKDPIDHQLLIANPEGAQLPRRTLRLAQRRGFGARDEHDRGQRWIREGLLGRSEALMAQGEARMGPEAGRAAGVGVEELAPCPGQRQQAERVTAGRRVEHHVLDLRAVAPRHEPGKLVERGDLRGARAGELLAHPRQLLRGLLAAVGREHPLAVRLGRRLRIDVHRGQPRNAGDRGGRGPQGDAQHLAQVRRRVGADEQHPAPPIREGNGRRARERGLADSAFAGEEEVARGLEEGIHGVFRWECLGTKPA